MTWGDTPRAVGLLVLELILSFDCEIQLGSSFLSPSWCLLPMLCPSDSRMFRFPCFRWRIQRGFSKKKCFCPEGSPISDSPSWRRRPYCTHSGKLKVFIFSFHLLFFLSSFGSLFPVFFQSFSFFYRPITLHFL